LGRTEQAEFACQLRSIAGVMNRHFSPAADRARSLDGQKDHERMDCEMSGAQ
jgi:hypothetical protein